jgi:hypothetical protein
VYHSQHFNLKKYSKKQTRVVRTTIAQPVSAPAPLASPSPTRSSRLALRARWRRRATPKGRGGENCLSKIEYLAGLPFLMTDITHDMIEILRFARQFRSPRLGLLSRSHHDAPSGR